MQILALVGHQYTLWSGLVSPAERLTPLDGFYQCLRKNLEELVPGAAALLAYLAKL